METRDSIHGRDKRFSSTPRRPDRLWSLRILLSSDTGVRFPVSSVEVKNSWSYISCAPPTSSLLVIETSTRTVFVFPHVSSYIEYFSYFSPPLQFVMYCQPMPS
jgi:hypothetical protein